MEGNQRHEAVWNARYRDAGDDYLFGKTPATFLARREKLFSKGERVFLVGDGDGRNSVWLAERGLEVMTIDIAAVAVEKAISLAASRKVKITTAIGDVTMPDWPPVDLHNRFDWVLGIFIQFVGGTKRARQFDAIKQLIRPGGRLLLHGYTPKQLDYKTGGPASLENLYTQKMLLEEFTNWEIEELIDYEEELAEGSRHNGRSALIGLIARKP